MILRDKHGWPIERTKGRYISNFFRLLFLTDIRQTMKRRNNGKAHSFNVEPAQLEKMLSELENEGWGDEKETYTSGYRSGHRNGQIELLRYILGKPDGATTAPEKGE